MGKSSKEASGNGVEVGKQTNKREEKQGKREENKYLGISQVVQVGHVVQGIPDLLEDPEKNRLEGVISH